MKKFIIGMLAVSTALLGFGISSASATTEHCPGQPGGPGKTEVGGGEGQVSQESANTYVPDAGVMVCVKAGTENTGIVEADGEKDLQDYLHDAGIDGGNGEARDVSYWVEYPEEDLVSISVCLDGEVEVFGPGLQADVDLEVAAAVALGGVVFEDGDTCDAPEEETTTTTTTTVVEENPGTPLTLTGAPVVPVVEAAPLTAAPVAAPVALPHTL